MKIFVIIPAYNEGYSLGTVLSGLSPFPYTAVVIDDGSQDDTANIACSHGAVVLTHCVNLGQGAALQTGIEYARQCHADVIVTFDADGQHRAADIPFLLDALEKKDVDIVLGSRFLGEAIGIGWLRKKMLKLLVWYMNKTTGLQLTDAHNGFRALKVASTRCIRLKQNRMAHASEILQQIAVHKLRYAEIPCTIVYTPYSISKGQKLSQAVNIIADLFIRRLYK